ncbi:uroporphyrinogen-III synthase [Niveispirillum fermenti]|uniref:uroporphyrinogen-III synthase n=1 Tax=Niveispirillum fermenti TaxID=1233113 RepID=UPI003A85578C
MLVTRPQPGADETATALRNRGYHPILAPMLSIQPLPGPPIDLSGYDGVAVTSGNGLRALAARSSERHHPLHAVGRRTAELAHDLGFTRVDHADGDVASLTALLARSGAGRILHVAGADIAGELTPPGVAVERMTVYRALPADAIPAAGQQALRDGQVAYVSFFSPRTAACFVSLAEKAGLAPWAGGWTALCLSDAVARAAGRLGFGAMQIAAAPDAASLLALLPAVKGKKNE